MAPDGLAAWSIYNNQGRPECVLGRVWRQVMNERETERRTRRFKELHPDYRETMRYIKLLEMKLFAYQGAALQGIELLVGGKSKMNSPQVKGLLYQLYDIYHAETREEAHRQVMGGSLPHTALWNPDGSRRYEVMELTDEQKQERVRETEL
jgi:hypothetical protein